MVGNLSRKKRESNSVNNTEGFYYISKELEKVEQKTDRYWNNSIISNTNNTNNNVC